MKYKRKFLAVIVLALFSLFTFPAWAQNPDLNANSPAPHAASKQEKKAQKDKQKKIDKERKADQKAIKQHEKIQTKETRKRMKKSKKKANKWNEGR